MKTILNFVLLTVVLLATELHANALAIGQVPEPLQPWINWVLEDAKDRDCPFLYNSFDQKRCAWPSAINIDLQDSTGQFSSAWRVDAESWITLPGDGRHWPLDVKANNQPALVMLKNGSPKIKLGAGSYTISGRFYWDFIPENLKVPDDIGLINLTVRKKNIQFPSIKQGKLWLRDRDIGQRKPASIQNKLEIQVYRQIVDEIPLQVSTRIDLEVSGDQREVRLALPMLKNFIGMQLISPLPARLEPDGQLLLQARPGRWTITVVARSENEVSGLTLPDKIKGWPETELWVFAARPYLRVVEVENLRPIDPQLTTLPKAWKTLPAYRIEQGKTMKFKVIRRGDSHPEPDKLSLQRSLWLDFNGRGYTVNDRIDGTMTQGWRLNVLPEMQLGKVNLDGRNQLITRQGKTQKEGVEVRRGQINLSADSRLTGAINTISAVGWEQTFHQVSAVVNLPPGWRLFAAGGVDNVPQSWISRWTLLDLFLVLIASLAISRLWNLYWGLLALLTLALIWHEPGAPQFIWLNIVTAIALLKVLPQGKLFIFIRFYRNISLLGLVMMAIPFMIDQVRQGIYPQLEKPWQSISANPFDSFDRAQSNVQAPYMPQSEEIRPAAKSRRVSGLLESSADYYQSKSENFNRIDPGANVQTGPGLPHWQWNKVHLSWNGPVDNGQQIKFWFISPKISTLLNILRVVLLAMLVLLISGLVRENFKFKPPAFLVWLLLLSLMAMPTEESLADYPDQALLKELQSRLLKAPDCIPGCAQISTIQLAIDDKRLEISLEIQTQQTVYLPLPAQVEQWFPNEVTIDGKPAQGLFRSADGKLWVALGKGRHLLKMQGAVPLLSKFFIPLQLKPHRVVMKNQGWQVNGVFEHGIAAQQLQFTRLSSGGQDNSEQTLIQPGSLPPFLQVERTLKLGLDWQVNTRIKRVTPADSAVLVEIPLLVGESVISPGARVKNGKVLVNLPQGQIWAGWKSALKKTGAIKLNAEETEKWIEIWRADISPIWHLEMAGIAVVHHQDRQGSWLPEWRPWPGESVSLLITRPEAVRGQTLTIDNSLLTIKPGKRTVESVLELSLRSSLGSQHVLTLPEKIQVQSVTIDGKTQPLRLVGRTLNLPVKPGHQRYKISWREISPLDSYLTTPRIDLGTESVNSNLNISLGQDRWVLLTFGPAFGPAVLFWGVIIVLMMVATGLGRISVTPLVHWQWFLLLVGLSQIPVAAAGIVIGWLIVLGIRGDKTILERRYFNLAQVAIGLLTVLSLVILAIAVQQGLLGSPDMQISGNQSSALNLKWYQDRSPAELPRATVISVPLFVYRILMLVWSLWLALSLLDWLKWGWGCFSRDGLWKKSEQKKEQDRTG